MALLLSMYRGVHGMDCMSIGYAFRSYSSASILRNHNMFCSAVLEAIYLASRVLNAIAD